MYLIDLTKIWVNRRSHWLSKFPAIKVKIQVTGNPKAVVHTTPHLFENNVVFSDIIKLIIWTLSYLQHSENFHIWTGSENPCLITKNNNNVNGVFAGKSSWIKKNNYVFLIREIPILLNNFIFWNFKALINIQIFFKKQLLHVHFYLAPTPLTNMVEGEIPNITLITLPKFYIWLIVKFWKVLILKF